MTQTATVRWVGGEEFLAAMPSGHAIVMDADRQHNTAPGPMEMLLGALGACTAVDLVSILAKKRQDLKALEIKVSGDRAPDPPQVWTKIDVEYRLKGKLEEKAVRDAIELSQNKYCSVAAMLGKTANLSYTFRIDPDDK